MRQTGLYVLLIFFLFGGSAISNAQDASNLLRDGGFEGQYTGRRATGDLNVPIDWGLWQAQGPADQFINRADKTFAFPHNGPDPAPHGGSRALNLSGGYVTFTAAVYQQVAVTQGTPVQASAWAWLRTCNIAPNADKCGSAVESGAFTRIGIDPNGGTDPNDTDIVWSAESRPHDQWLQMTVSATPTAGTVTLFLYVTQRSPSQINNVYWDDAVLAGGGAGGAAAPVAGAATAAPPPAEVGFVVAQAAQDDGSIIHTVVGGDTVDSIAVAYGVTRADILALNNLTDPRIIVVGQRLIIRPAQGSGETSSETTSGAVPTESAAPAESAEPSTEAAAETAEQPVDAAPAENAAPTEVVPAVPTSTPAPAPVLSVASGVLPALDPALRNAKLCVILFDDVSPNTIREEGETALEGGTVEVLQAGQPIASQPTSAAADPLCFTDLAPGDYQVAATAPDGYGLTTPDDLSVNLLPGIDVNIEFGASQGFQPASVLPADAEAGGLVSDVAAQETDTRTLGDQVFEISGLLMFGLAGLVLVGGLGITLLSRRR